MTRLFGTDGIRGVANLDLRPSLAFALGRATAHQVVGAGGTLVVGCDTRRSGDMFVAAITAGATSMGADVHQVGIVPTPALAFLAADGDFAAGIMVSASHNPAEDNGLKVLDPRGLKLDDDVEDELEAAVLARRRAAGRRAGIDRAHGRCRPSARAVRRAPPALARGRRRGAACTSSWTRANGAASAWRPRSCARPARRVTVIHDAPDGDNINRAAARRPRRRSPRPCWPPGADVGFALDGDADRCVAVDGEGNLVDGDQLLGILALERLARGALDHGSLVVLGALERRAPGGGRGGRRAARAHPRGRQAHPRGDAGLGRRLGGEKSGHVIIREHTTAGDGIVTAIELLRVMTAAGAIRGARDGRAAPPAAAARHPGPPPRPVGGRRRPRACIADAERRLSPHGRVLVRPSGTEPVLRVMVEGPDAALVSERLADAIAALAGDRLH